MSRRRLVVPTEEVDVHELSLLRRARRAYERARLLRAVAAAWPGGLALAIGLIQGCGILFIVLATMLSVAIAVLTWR